MKKALSILLLLAITALASAQTIEKYLVNSKTLNMRSGAGKEFEVIATLSMRDEVTVLEKNDNGWWLVDYDGKEGYVFSKMLIIDPYSGWDKKSYESGETPECENGDWIDTEWLIRNYGSDYKIIIVGDAAMAPEELFSPTGNYRGPNGGLSGMDWLQRIKRSYKNNI